VIHILFVPGTFGSTVQYLIRQFNTELSGREILYQYKDLILPDGSMHSVVKIGHYGLIQELYDYLDGKIDQEIEVTSPMYPMPNFGADKIINLFKTRRPNDQYIFIYITDIKYAEINMLAQYYKVAKGLADPNWNWVPGGDEIIQKNIVSWNPVYTHWSQMQPWEFREWLSIFYPTWIQEWVDAKKYIPQNWFSVSSRDILENTNSIMIDIINHVGKFDNSLKNEFDEFISLWRSKQQYLIDEHNVIENIVKSTISNIPYNWKKMNIISEAMVQKKLYDEGYKIKCFNLNEFPTNSIELKSLLTHI